MYTHGYVRIQITATQAIRVFTRRSRVQNKRRRENRKKYFIFPFSIIAIDRVSWLVKAHDRSTLKIQPIEQTRFASAGAIICPVHAISFQAARVTVYIHTLTYTLLRRLCIFKQRILAHGSYGNRAVCLCSQLRTVRRSIETKGSVEFANQRIDCRCIFCVIYI